MPPATPAPRPPCCRNRPGRALKWWQRLLWPPGLPLGAGQQTPRLRSALEGLLEDRVLDDVGQLHFAIEPGAQVGQALWVAVCDRDWLRENLQALEAAGRRVARVVPEFAPGPTASAGPELCALGTPEDAYLVLSGQGADQGVAVLPLSRMALALAQTGSAADQTPVLRAEPAVAALAERTLGQSAGLYTASQRALDAARSHWDLAQFDLASSGSRRAMRKAGSTLSAWLYAPRWRAARWGAGLLALTQLAGLNVWAWHERQTLAAKQAAVHAVLTQTFAQVQVVANAPVQMENELARLRQAAGSVSASDLEPMLPAPAAAPPGCARPQAASGPATWSPCSRPQTPPCPLAACPQPSNTAPARCACVAWRSCPTKHRPCPGVCRQRATRPASKTATCGCARRPTHEPTDAAADAAHRPAPTLENTGAARTKPGAGRRRPGDAGAAVVAGHRPGLGHAAHRPGTPCDARHATATHAPPASRGAATASGPPQQPRRHRGRAARGAGAATGPQRASERAGRARQRHPPRGLRRCAGPMAGPGPQQCARQHAASPVDAQCGHDHGHGLDPIRRRRCGPRAHTMPPGQRHAPLGRHPGAGTACARPLMRRPGPQPVPIPFQSIPTHSHRPMVRPARPAPGPASRPMWGWALAGACAGVLPALLVFAPAHWLADSVAHASSGQLLLLQPRGTVWNGSAQLVLAGGSASQDRAALPGTVTWQLRPRFNGLRARLHASCCPPEPLQARVDAGWSGIRLRVADGQSQWPAAQPARQGTPRKTQKTQGKPPLRTRALEMRWTAGRMQLSGQARLDALAMSTRLSTLRPMGSYRLVLQGGEVPAVTLSTLDGALQLSGSGHWVGQRLRFAGQASASPARAAALSNPLNLIHPPDRARRRPTTWTTVGGAPGPRSIITVG